MSVVTDANPRSTTAVARCSECGRDGWDMPEAWTTYDARNLRGKARRHAEATGHHVQFSVETTRSVTLRRQDDPREERT